MPMHLTTSRLLIRPLCPADALDVHAFAGLREVMAPAGLAPHGNLSETRLALTDWMQSGGHALQLPETDQVVGLLLVRDAHLTVMVHPNFQRMGLGTEAVLAAAGDCFRHGLPALYARCFQRDTASRALLSRCGFEESGSGVLFSQLLERELPATSYRLTPDILDANLSK